MANLFIKNLARAIYESSQGKDGILIDSMIEKSAIFIKDKNLLGKKEEILKALENIINKEEGIVISKITTKFKIDSKLEKEIEEFIKSKYKAQKVQIELKVDPNVLGGIKIETGNDIIDTTLSNKIYQLQNYLITN